MVPVIGLDSANSDEEKSDKDRKPSLLAGAGTFIATQPERLVKAIAGEMNIQDYGTIVSYEPELFDTQPAQLGGIGKELFFAGRVDDKLCYFAAIEALIASAEPSDSDPSSIKLVGCFDDEEIGSLLR
ncbi:hypothetical protein ABVK25_008876 [Lepraria finkii]|uniref:Uncharacterized protein n=1 Tax=Lepraria finkii TaxID=1340010 RepID=A0ABR4AZB0_9LECA